MPARRTNASRSPSGEVLPSADAFILDEAHQLPETAARFFGQRISARQLADLARDAVAEQLRDAPDAGGIRAAGDGVEQATVLAPERAGLS